MYKFAKNIVNMLGKRANTEAGSETVQQDQSDPMIGKEQ